MAYFLILFLLCICHNPLFFIFPTRFCREETRPSSDSSGNSSDNGCTSPVDMIKRASVFRYDKQSSTERWEHVYGHASVTPTEAVFESMGWDWTMTTVIQWRCHEQSQKHLRCLKRFIGIVSHDKIKETQEHSPSDRRVRPVWAVSEGLCKGRLGWWMTSSKSPSLCRRYTSLPM